MNVVQVAPYPAREPVSGSQQRIDGLLAGRGEGDAVERFAPRPGDGLVGDGQVTSFDVADDYVERQYEVGRQPVLGALSRLFPRSFSDVQPAFKVLESVRMRMHAPAALRRSLDEADVAVVEHPWQFDYVARHGGDVPVVYSSHNVETEYHRFLADRAVTRPLLAAVERVERRAVSRADLVVTTSQRDADRYREEYDSSGRYHVAPNAVRRPDDAGPSDRTASDRAPRPDGMPDDAFTCLFVGTAHRPNRVAVDRLRAVAREAEAVAFVVVGTVGSVFDTASLPDNVHVTGYVDDLAPYYAAADLALNPITTGSGSNVKLPTYFANRLPVLTTPFGARGLPVTDGEHCLVAPLAEFPDVLTAAAAGAYDLDGIGNRARDLVATELHWEQVSADLFERLREL